MILCLEVLSTILSLLYTFLFFWMLHTFLPVRKHWGLRIPAFLCFCYIADVIIYSNDLSNLLGVLVGFLLYVMLFHQGRWMAKAAAVLVFYPALIAINYLMLDTSSRLFFSFTGASGDSSLIPWSPEDYLWSTLFHTAALFLRLLFWALAWFCLRRYLGQISASLTSSMWLIVDTLMLAPFVAIFTILCFLPENIAIVYPICFASIFSSFGCIYLAAYICTSVQTTYRAQALEKQKTYYKDRLQDEERVRQIYHDMKNHLLVLQSQSENSPVLHQAAQTLQDQLQAYESYQHTGNEYLDAIIRDKARLAREKSIDFTSVIHFEAGHFLDPLDISTLFGNALDNAIEACMQLPDAQRLVTVKTSRVRDMLLVLVENTMSSSLVWNGRTTKEDPFLHGFGLANIPTYRGKIRRALSHPWKGRNLYLKNSPADSLITFCSAAPSFGAALHSCFLDFTFSVLIYAFSLVVFGADGILYLPLKPKKRGRNHGNLNRIASNQTVWPRAESGQGIG